MVKKDFSLIINGQNNNDLLSLVSHYGKPDVHFSVNNNEHTNEMVVTSKEDLMRIIDFLQQRCDAEETVSTNNYKPTGTGLCVMDYSGKVLETYYGKGNHGIEEDTDSWTFELLQQRFPNQNDIYVLFELFDFSIKRNSILKVLQACIRLQSRFVATGHPMHCRQLFQQDVADVTGIDNTVVSRTTKKVRILTPRKTFTLINSADPNWDTPSLFDAGSRQYGVPVSRLEVLYRIKEMIAAEKPAKPMSDAAIYMQLSQLGYEVKRRTVAKYREELLGLPNSNERRVK